MPAVDRWWKIPKKHWRRKQRGSTLLPTPTTSTSPRTQDHGKPGVDEETMTTEKVAWERNALTKIFFLQHSAFVFPAALLASLSSFSHRILPATPAQRKSTQLGSRGTEISLESSLDLGLFVSGLRLAVPEGQNGRTRGGALPRMESWYLPQLPYATPKPKPTDVVSTDSPLLPTTKTT